MKIHNTICKIEALGKTGVNHRLKKLAIPKIQEFQLKCSVSLNSLIFHFTGTNPDRLKFSGPQSITCFVLSIFVSSFFRMQKILMDSIFVFLTGSKFSSVVGLRLATLPRSRQFWNIGKIWKITLKSWRDIFTNFG